MPVPKPFPSPLRVGADLASISRQLHLINRLQYREATDQRSSLNSFLGKVFNRLEWPEVEAQLLRARLVFHTEDVNGATASPQQRQEQVAKLKKFATWLAGRWAAKEAAIKAHPHRKLHMRQISILTPVTLNQHCAGFSPSLNERRPLALVDPPGPCVLLSPEVAQLRGLAPAKGRAHQSEDQSTVDDNTGYCDRFEPTFSRHSKVSWRVRRARVDMARRQLAELSISHDGDFAMATVLAVQDDASASMNAADIIDDGSSQDSLHEPDYGDSGFRMT